MVLFVDHARELGGAEHSLLLLLQRLDRQCFRPCLACGGDPLARRAANLGVPVHIIALPRLRRSPLWARDWLRGAHTLAAHARAVGARLFVANTVRAAFYTTLAARLTGIPFVWHMRDFWLSEEQPKFVWADRLGKTILGAAACCIIANSHSTAAHLPCPRKVVVVHNGIDTTRYTPQMDGRPFRQQHAIPTAAPLVGVVGRLRPWKGQARFLRMAASIARARPDAWFAIVGGTILDADHSYGQKLQRMVIELGLAERVVFTGQLDDVRPALAAMDVFVHPGDPEPFGLATVEAMAMGKPVVAFSHGALPEIVEEGVGGLLAPPGDEEALAQAVLALLSDEGRRAAMGQAGRTHVERAFTAERMAAGVATVLAACLTRK